MYTLVLMTAMSTAPATPQFDGFFRDLFNGGCHGSCTGRDAARSGSSCQGSCHGSCNGCQGGLFQGRIRNFFSDLFDGRSCQGSCHGSCNGRPRDRDPLPIARPYDRGLDPAYARGGCVGGGIAYGGGCSGTVPLYLGSCFGSTPNYSCFGTSCMGGVPGLPPMSVPGVPYDFATPQPVGFGAPGCDCLPGTPTGGLPLLNTPLGTDPYPTITPPGLPMVPRVMPDGFDNPAQPTPADGRGGAAFKLPLDDDASRGRVLVKVPADAKLFVEGKQLSVTNGERTFVTPPLPADREAVYTFKVEYTRDGETVTLSRKVKVRANATTSVDFVDRTQAVKADPPAALPPVPMPPSTPAEAVKAPQPTLPQVPFDSRTTTKPADPKPATDVPTVTPPPGLDVAKITVKLPKGATLFVNGGKNERTELVREFTTPSLTPGKVYQYTMKAEVVRNGLPEYQESKVEFRAGDALTVDFTSLADPRSAAK
jgi:uncharacterized protein (TIGR03000 family)